MIATCAPRGSGLERALRALGISLAALLLAATIPAWAEPTEAAAAPIAPTARGAHEAPAVPIAQEGGGAAWPANRLPSIAAAVRETAAIEAPAAPTAQAAAQDARRAKRPPSSAAAAADAGALEALSARIAEALARRIPPSTTRLALRVEAASPPLAAAGNTALAAALRDAGFAPPLPAADEEALEGNDADALLAVRLGLEGDRLVAAGAIRALRENFFTGEALVLDRAFAESVVADAAARLLATTLGPLRIELLPFARLDRPPLALAVGTVGGRPAVAAITADAIFLFDADGSLLLRHDLPPTRAGAAPARDPRAGIAFGGDGEIHYALPSRGRAAILRFDGKRFAVARERPADRLPIACGGVRIAFGELVDGTNLFAPTILVGAPAAAPRAVIAERPFVAAAADARCALGVVEADGTFRLLEASAIVAGVGDAVALADLDGDGSPELIATARTAAAPDRVRVQRLDAPEPPIAGAPVDALLVVAAAGDLGASGEEAILGAADGTLFRLRRAR